LLRGYDKVYTYKNLETSSAALEKLAAKALRDRSLSDFITALQRLSERPAARSIAIPEVLPNPSIDPSIDLST
jgi:hypothetical protein